MAISLIRQSKGLLIPQVQVRALNGQLGTKIPVRMSGTLGGDACAYRRLAQLEEQSVEARRAQVRFLYLRQ